MQTAVMPYVNYLQFMELARTERLRGPSFTQFDLASENLLSIMHHSQARYHALARFDDKLLVSVRVQSAFQAAGLPVAKCNAVL